MVLEQGFLWVSFTYLTFLTFLLLKFISGLGNADITRTVFSRSKPRREILILAVKTSVSGH